MIKSHDFGIQSRCLQPLINNYTSPLRFVFTITTSQKKSINTKIPNTQNNNKNTTTIEKHIKISYILVQVSIKEYLCNA